MRFTPRSRARCTSVTAVVSPYALPYPQSRDPNCQQPSPIADSRNPAAWTYFIAPPAGQVEPTARVGCVAPVLPGHELDADTVGIGEEHDVDAGVGASPVEDGAPVAGEALRGGVD